MTKIGLDSSRFSLVSTRPIKSVVIIFAISFASFLTNMTSIVKVLDCFFSSTASIVKVMQKTKGKADPKLTLDLLKKEIE